VKMLKLTVAGFGPFREEQVVDFGACNDAGLFMVAGPTGSGKTTLLDAMAFALYGETTGAGQGAGEADGRKAADLRCTACTPEQPTFVELEFEAGGRRWRVRRNPSYQRAARRGGGVTEEAANASLERQEGGEWQPEPGVRKVPEVTARIAELLGLSADQFRRVIVIPQGRFREVLLSEPKDRLDLLKRIFGTHLYERFATLVRERAAASQRAIEQMDAQRDALVRDHDWCAGLDMAAMQAAAEVRRQQADEAHRLAREAEAARDRSLDTANKALQAAAYRNGHLDAVARAEKQHADARATEVALADRGRELAEARRVAEAVDAVQRERAAVRACDEARAAREASAAAVEPLRGGLQAAEFARASAAEAQLQEGAELAAEVGQIRATLPALEERTRERGRAGDRVRAAGAALAAATREAVEAKNSQAAAASVERSTADALAAARDAYRANRAAILAADLRPGCACPVCGSTAHPAPARAGAGAVDDAALAASEQADVAARAAREHADAQVLRVEERVRAAAADVNRLEQELATLGDDPSEQAARLVARRGAIEARITLLGNAAQTAENAARRARERLDAAERAHQSAIGAETTAEGQRAASAAARAAALAAIGATDADVDAIVAAARPASWIDASERELRRASDAVRTAEGALAAARDAAGDARRSELGPLEADVAAWTEQRDRARGEVQATAIACSTLTTLVAALDDLADRSAAAEAGLRPAHELNALVAGAVGEHHVSLHAWVLGAFLDKVLSVASRRMQDLTRGRYQLRRMAGALDGRSQAGLNVEVFDSHTGTARPARTLSGGETFLASLSMALALAEVAAARGGRALDTVFIDEGFGTLDSETLDTAMDVLTRLRDAGRTVGLISHVDEMKRRIPTAITVRKDTATGLSRVVQG
jgi:exonuclease SbcC